MKDERTYREKYISMAKANGEIGLALVESLVTIDKLIDQRNKAFEELVTRWHQWVTMDENGLPLCPLSRYMGLTDAQYAKWLENPMVEDLG